MDQQLFINNLVNPPGQFNLSSNRIFSQPSQFDISTTNQAGRMFSNRELIVALMQINRMLEQDLILQLNKNRVLLEMLCLSSKQQVKQEESPVVQIANFKQKSQEEQQSGQKQKKLTTNDTKNISKNFGKAIITFIQKNPQKVNCILEIYKIDVQKFSNQLKERKKKLISIKQLRSLWLDSQFQYAKPFREISYLFLKKASFKYIFGSRIADYAGHLKYRRRMIEALQRPESFTSIKQ